MSRISFSLNGNSPFQKLLGHNIDVMEAWNHLGNILEKDGSLSAELKEQVRRALAQENGCEYCKAKGKPDPAVCNEKISLDVALHKYF
jgi:alkylhydroperoxidase family enzyme